MQVVRAWRTSGRYRSTKTSFRYTSKNRTVMLLLPLLLISYGSIVSHAFMIPRVVLMLPQQRRRFVVAYEHRPMIPKPPSIPPPAEFFEKTLKEQENVARTVQMLQQKVISLQEELAGKQIELENVSSNVVEQEEESAERERLEREVEILQSQLPTIQNLYKTEQRRAEELEERIADLDYTLEYQQMEFNKIQQELQENLEKEQSKLKKIEAQMKEREGKYKSLQMDSEDEIDRELERKKQSEETLRTKQKEFDTEKKRLEDLVENQSVKIKKLEVEMEEQLKLQQTGASVALQAEIVREREKFKTAETSLEEMEKSYVEMEQELRSKLVTATSRADNLAKHLEQEQIRFESTQLDLVERLEEESSRVAALEEELQTERLEARSKEKLLEDMYNNEVQSRRHKKEQMSNRYEKIRQEMTALWQGARREGRQQAEKLTKKYEGVIGELRNTIADLEQTVKKATEENSTLRQQLERTIDDRDSAQAQRQQTERDYQKVISGQTVEIESLQYDLNKAVSVVKEKEQEMEAFKSSWRGLFKAGVQLTAKRVLGKPLQFLRNRAGRKRHDNKQSD